jgi:diguanylate cyclase (GGDEF)-like protein
LGYEIQKEYIKLLKDISDKELALTALKLEIKLGMENLRKKIDIDYLTGVYSGSFVERTANDWLMEAKQTGCPITCMAIDIDKFKTINDKYGHLFGDEVIKQAANVFLRNIREGDIHGRYGGDEFVVLSKGIGAKATTNIAERLLSAVRNLRINRDEENVPITISVGICDNSEENITSFSQLFNLADKRLYEAKRNGRNTIAG